MSTDSLERGFPPVTWEEVATHLVKRLAIDKEWAVLRDGELSWWASPLKTTIKVVASRDIEDGENPDNLLQLVAETYVVDCDDEALGIQLVTQANGQHLLGAYIWDEGVIRVRNVLALNPLCRPLLSLFHTQILAGATDAFRNYRIWSESVLTPGHLEAHPLSGFRHDCDELLGIFSGSYSLPQDLDLPKRLELAREIITEQMTSIGWQIGHTTDEVQYFQNEYVNFGIGVRDEPEIEKYGWGVTLMGGFNGMLMEFPDEQINEMNRDLTYPDMTSQFGPMISGRLYDDGYARFTAFLPHGFLQECGRDPLMLATNLGNAAVHFISQLSFLANSSFTIPAEE